MVLSPLGDVEERRQTSVFTGGVILRSSKGMWMRQMNTPQVSKVKLVGLACLLAGVAIAASANDRDQAKRIYDRIAGVPPSEATLDTMEGMVAGGNAIGAALIATQAPSFYNVTLKNMAVPWTNRDQTVFAPLNDYVATFIGMVRDDVAFNTALSADLTYTVSGSTPAASASSNDHYANAESNSINLFTALTPTTQSSVLGIPAEATAGFITSRASSEAFFIDGTNRAMFRFTLMNHMCRDLEQVHDTSLPPDRIRQDVSRSPGGDSRIFLNNCIGCHSGMDPFAQAFAYYDFDNGSAEAPGSMRLVYDAHGRPLEVLQQQHELRSGLRHPERRLGKSLAHRPEFIARLGRNACRAAATAPSPWVTSSPTARPSLNARSRKYSRPCASARRAPLRTRPGDRGSRQGRGAHQQLQEQRLPAETGFRRSRRPLHGRMREHT